MGHGEGFKPEDGKMSESKEAIVEEDVPRPQGKTTLQSIVFRKILPSYNLISCVFVYTRLTVSWSSILQFNNEHFCKQ